MAMKATQQPDAAMADVDAAQDQLGHYDAALVDLDRAVELDAFDPWPLYIRGLVKGKAGDQPGSETDLKAAQAIWPDAAVVIAKDGIR
jgi:hypothetical protein